MHGVTMHFIKLFQLLLTFSVTYNSLVTLNILDTECEVCAYIWWRFYLKLGKSNGKAM